jgi:DNA-binding response OmpR family regulator
VAGLLIVDDEADVREFAANFFKRRKISVDTAASGEEALEKIGKEPPVLVLLDIKMEGIDGVETLRRIRLMNAGVKVVMVTGRKPDEEQSSAQCLELGAVNYVHKPLVLEELEKIVLQQMQG